MKRIFNISSFPVYIPFLFYILFTTYTLSLQAQNPDRRIWFDKPCTSTGKTAWSGATNLVNSGDGIQNSDLEWENCSLPIGNGNIGANIAERRNFLQHFGVFPDISLIHFGHADKTARNRIKNGVFLSIEIRVG